VPGTEIGMLILKLGIVEMNKGSPMKLVIGHVKA
jgi:hypothetical protein